MASSGLRTGLVNPRGAPLWPTRNGHHSAHLRPDQNALPHPTGALPHWPWQRLLTGPSIAGGTTRMRSNPKFHIPRAAAPIFSPIWGRTKTTLGCGCEDGMKTSAVFGRDLSHACPRRKPIFTMAHGQARFSTLKGRRNIQGSQDGARRASTNLFDYTVRFRSHGVLR